jgi:hypothetical protein
MANRKVYHVTKNRNDGWDVKRENADRATKNVETKDEAIKVAKELAKNANLGQVIIHKQDGKIQTEYTYGKDPYPPEG